ncbi:MAG: YdcF family protein [Rhodospirillales bacterium]|nr:YdcF family protein [Rhodospirillales bacterium]
MRPHRKGRFFAGWLLALLVLVGAWAGGLVAFAASLPREPDEPQTRTDAVVVLTGGRDRLEAGLDILERGLAGKLFVSGVYRGVEVHALVKLTRLSPSMMECCVVLGYTADNTVGNARETGAWMAAQNFTSLRLVTANYHMRRSLLEFRAAMPTVKLVAHPVFPERFKAEDWWRWPGTLALLASEYSKYLLVHARLILQGA